MSALDQYSYLFFVCEGKNEEAIVKWLAEADAIDFPKKQYSLDFCRARTKSTRPKILRAATQFDYGGPVAIIMFVILMERNGQWGKIAWGMKFR